MKEKEGGRKHLGRMLAADHLQQHAKEMMSTLTNALTHSKEKENKKEWKKCAKTTQDSHQTLKRKKVMFICV